jgi:hypothetical protein
MKRIKHNNLLPWFTDDHGTLPAAYVKSCKEFFDKIKQTPEAPYKNFFWPTVPQRQATSDKRQAATVHKPGLRVKNRFRRNI